MMAETRSEEYRRPDIVIEFFESENTVTTSGYLFIAEGFGDEVYW